MALASRSSAPALANATIASKLSALYLKTGDIGQSGQQAHRALSALTRLDESQCAQIEPVLTMVIATVSELPASGRDNQAILGLLEVVAIRYPDLDLTTWCHLRELIIRQRLAGHNDSQYRSTILETLARCEAAGRYKDVLPILQMVRDSSSRLHANGRLYSSLYDAFKLASDRQSAHRSILQTFARDLLANSSIPPEARIEIVENVAWALAEAKELKEANDLLAALRSSNLEKNARHQGGAQALIDGVAQRQNGNFGPAATLMAQAIADLPAPRDYLPIQQFFPLAGWLETHPDLVNSADLLPALDLLQEKEARAQVVQRTQIGLLRLRLFAVAVQQNNWVMIAGRLGQMIPDGQNPHLESLYHWIIDKLAIELRNCKALDADGLAVCNQVESIIIRKYGPTSSHLMNCLRAKENAFARAKDARAEEAVMRQYLALDISDHDKASAYQHLASPLVKQHRLPEALAALDQADRLNTRPFDRELAKRGRYLRATYLHSSGHVREAEAVVRKGIRQYTDTDATPSEYDLQMLDLLARILQESNRHDEALALQRRIMANANNKDLKQILEKLGYLKVPTEAEK